jgi:hypothetical protein
MASSSRSTAKRHIDTEGMSEMKRYMDAFLNSGFSPGGGEVDIHCKKGPISLSQHCGSMLGSGLFFPKVAKENKGVMGENKPRNAISPVCIQWIHWSFLAVIVVVDAKGWLPTREPCNCCVAIFKVRRRQTPKAPIAGRCAFGWMDPPTTHKPRRGFRSDTFQDKRCRRLIGKCPGFSFQHGSKCF